MATNGIRFGFGFVRAVGEGDTLGGDFLVELCDGCDVLVDDRLVDKRPKSFGGLQLRGVGWQINEANAIGDFEISWPMPPRIVEHEKDDAAQARFGSRAKVASSASKNSFDTPLETYQKVSPVAGETNAVT